MLWQDWDLGYAATLVRSVDGAPAETYLDVAPGYTSALELYGDTMTWVQSWGFHYGPTGEYLFERSELWTAQYSEDPADLAPRRLATLASRPVATTHGPGRYALIRDGVQVFDVETGRRQHYRPAGPGIPQIFGPPMYVTPDEVLLNLGLDGYGGPKKVDLTRVPFADE